MGERAPGPPVPNAAADADVPARFLLPVLPAAAAAPRKDVRQKLPSVEAHKEEAASLHPSPWTGYASVLLLASRWEDGVGEHEIDADPGSDVVFSLAANWPDLLLLLSLRPHRKLIEMISWR